MKKLIYLVLCISLTAISCGVASTLPTAAPAKNRPLIVVPTMSQTATGQATINFYVSAQTLYVRSAPGMSSPVIGDALKYGAMVVIIGQPVTTADGAQWVEVVSAENGGISGWVNMRYLVAR